MSSGVTVSTPTSNIPNPTEEPGLLTDAEAEAIKTTWGLVRTDLKGNGVKFFQHFFTGYPEYQKLFRGFADIPIADLAGNKRLQAHAFTVMTAITGLVDNLDDPDVLVELLHSVGRNHYRRSLRRGDFEIIRESLVEFLGKALGDHWNLQAEVAWKKAFEFIVEKVGEGLAAAADAGK